MGAEKNGTVARIRITSLESHPVDHLGTHSLLENQQKNKSKEIGKICEIFFSVISYFLDPFECQN